LFLSPPFPRSCHSSVAGEFFPLVISVRIKARCSGAPPPPCLFSFTALKMLPSCPLLVHSGYGDFCITEWFLGNYTFFQQLSWIEGFFRFPAPRGVREESPSFSFSRQATWSMQSWSFFIPLRPWRGDFPLYIRTWTSFFPSSVLLSLLLF